MYIYIYIHTHTHTCIHTYRNPQVARIIKLALSSESRRFGVIFPYVSASGREVGVSRVGVLAEVDENAERYYAACVYTYVYVYVCVCK